MLDLMLTMADLMLLMTLMMMMMGAERTVDA
jgi:hypothetical protein